MRIFVSGANMKDNSVSFISSYLALNLYILFNMAAVNKTVIDDVATTKPIMADFSKISG